MSPSPSVVLEIQTWLKGKHIVVPFEWIEACIEFLQQELNSTNLPLLRLKARIYEQWLAADLREIGSSTLPSSDFTDATKSTLNGCFALQVNGIRDVGKPAYAQLREIEGSSNGDTEVSAAPKVYAPEWETKPTRMLVLDLTDGTILIEGMEYRPITILSPNLPPGIKVLVQGPVDCRLGMLLLTPDKIEILGGQVDHFQSIYSREGILRKALNLTSRNDRSAVSSTTQQANHDRNNDFEPSDAVQQVQRPSMHHMSRTSRHNGINSSNAQAIQPCRNTKPNSSNSTDVINCFESDDDDFVSSIDYDALDKIERANTQMPNSQHDDNDDCQIIEYGNHLLSEDFMDDADPPFDDTVDGSNCIAELMEYESDCQRLSKEEESTSAVTLLSDVDLNREEEFTITIKGYIVNVLSRLECKLNTGWHLAAKVSDGTCTIDADFHDEVLEGLVGISAANMMVMQKECREKPELKSKMMEAVGGCKQKLQELNCLLVLKIAPGKRPCVIQCLDDCKN